jgi:hypothetical protein
VPILSPSTDRTSCQGHLRPGFASFLVPYLVLVMVLSMARESTGEVDSLVEVAGDVLYLDTTPDDVADLGVRVAKAIVPGFQPIHFGAREARLGGPRLRELPWRLGLRDRAATLAELNHAPHPMA